MNPFKKLIQKIIKYFMGEDDNSTCPEKDVTILELRKANYNLDLQRNALYTKTLKLQETIVIALTDDLLNYVENKQLLGELIFNDATARFFIVLDHPELPTIVEFGTAADLILQLYNYEFAWEIFKNDYLLDNLDFLLTKNYVIYFSNKTY